MKLAILEGPEADAKMRSLGSRHYLMLEAGKVRPFISDPSRVAATVAAMSYGEGCAFFGVGEWEVAGTGDGKTFAAVRAPILAEFSSLRQTELLTESGRLWEAAKQGGAS